MTNLFNACLFACLIALVVAGVSLVWRLKVLGYVTLAALSVGFVSMTSYMVWRWAQAGRAPFSDMFESLFLFAWAIVAVHLAISIKVRLRWLDFGAALLAVLTLAYASTFPSHIQPLMPALRSNWLQFHVLTCFLGYAAFELSFNAAVSHLIATRPGSQVSEDTGNLLESITTKTISFGFLFLTIGIVSGAVWANSAWGTYWSWDPKETWSLITWLVYALFLHCRFMRGWRGRLTSLMSIVGFASVLFTYFGVNFLSILRGLHSYAT